MGALEGVQDLAGALPRARVAGHVLGEAREVQPVEQGEQFAAHGTRKAAQARQFEQVGVAAGAYGEEAQHVGGGVRVPRDERPRLGEVQERGEGEGLALAQRYGRGQPVGGVGRVGVAEEEDQVVVVLRAQRGAAGEQRGEFGGGLHRVRRGAGRAGPGRRRRRGRRVSSHGSMGPSVS